MPKNTRLERLVWYSMQIIVKNDKRSTVRPLDSEIVSRAFKMAKQLDESFSAEETRKLTETKIKQANDLLS